MRKILALGLALLASAGCGGGREVTIVPVEGDGAGLSMLTAAAASTAAIDSGRMVLTSTTTYDSEMMSGWPTSTFGLTVSASFSGGNFGFEVDQSGDFPESGTVGDVTVTGLPDGAGRFEGRFVAGVSYLRSALFGGGAWLRIPEVDGEPAGGADEEFVDVAELLSMPGDLLDGASEGVELVGPETVRAGAATHYRVPFATWPSEGSWADLGFEGGADAPVDLWVNGDGLLVKLAVTGSSGGMSGSLEIEFFDLGADLTVDAPTDAVDAESILEQGLGSSVFDDPALVERIYAVAEEIRAETADMTADERDAYMEFRVVELSGEDPQDAAIIRTIIEAQLAIGG